MAQHGCSCTHHPWLGVHTSETTHIRPVSILNKASPCVLPWSKGGVMRNLAQYSNSAESQDRVTHLKALTEGGRVIAPQHPGYNSKPNDTAC
jgi:hypothetical protein